MSASLLLLLLLPLLVVVGVVVLVVALIRRPDPAPSEAAEAARRHGAAVNVAAWLVALLLAGPATTIIAVVVLRTSSTGPYQGVVTALFPAATGLIYLAVHAVGERTWPRPDGPVRRAALTHRRVADVAPRHLRVVTWSWVGALAVALVIGGATAAPHGRSVATSGIDWSSSAGPYPGWYYGVWLLPAALVVLGATEAVLRLVAARPAIVDADPAYDAGSRRLSAHRVLRGAQLVLGVTLAGVLVVGGIALQNVELRGLGATVTILGVLVGLGSAAMTVVPTRAPSSGIGPVPAPSVARDAA